MILPQEAQFFLGVKKRDDIMTPVDPALMPLTPNHRHSRHNKDLGWVIVLLPK